MKNPNEILTDEKTEITAITQVSRFYGEVVDLHPLTNAQGKYVLARVLNKEEGTKPSHAVNKVYVDTLKDVVHHLCDNDFGVAYHIWLTYKSGGLQTLRLRAPKAVTVHYIRDGQRGQLRIKEQ